MSYSYRIHELAHDEYMDAYEWYEFRKKGLGDRFMLEVEKVIKQITNHPMHFPQQRGNYRSVKVKGFPYAVLYEFFEHKNSIDIVAIYHSKRNPAKKFRKI